MPSQQLQRKLQKQRSIDTSNYSTEKQKHSSHKARLGSSTVEKVLQQQQQQQQQQYIDRSATLYLFLLDSTTHG
jgi:hypothetical protein